MEVSSVSRLNPTNVLRAIRLQEFQPDLSYPRAEISARAEFLLYAHAL